MRTILKDALGITWERFIDDNKTWRYVLAFAIVIMFVVCVIIYEKIDFQPALFDDYEPLNAIIVSVPQNPETLLEHEGTIVMDADTITYTVENEEAKMTGIYNRDNFELLEKKQEDKAAGRGLTNFVILLFCFMGTLMLWVILYFLLILGYFVTRVVNLFRMKKKEEKASKSEPDLEENDDDHTPNGDDLMDY